MEANPAETYVTADGNVPVIPGSAEVADTQIAVSAVVGDQKVTQPPLFGDHMQIPTVRLISSGTPTVLVAW
jgi:hypothetical protein